MLPLDTIRKMLFSRGHSVVRCFYFIASVRWREKRTHDGGCPWRNVNLRIRFFCVSQLDWKQILQLFAHLETNWNESRNGKARTFDHCGVLKWEIEMFSARVLRNKQGMPVYDRGRTNCTVTFYCEFYVLDFTSFQGDSVTNALRRNKKKEVKT